MRFASEKARKTAEAKNKKKEKKLRGPRPVRVFRYRGIWFQVINKKDYVSIFTGDEDHNFTHQVDAPVDSMKSVCSELAKVARAEQAIAKLVASIKQSFKEKDEEAHSH